MERGSKVRPQQVAGTLRDDEARRVPRSRIAEGKETLNGVSDEDDRGLRHQANQLDERTNNHGEQGQDVPETVGLHALHARRSNTSAGRITGRGPSRHGSRSVAARPAVEVSPKRLDGDASEGEGPEGAELGTGDHGRAHRPRRAAVAKKSAGWVQRWGDTIAAEPEQPGVWRRKDGGFRIRARTTDPRTGKLREVNRALPDVRRAREAAAILETELERIRRGSDVDAPAGFPRFADYAVDLLERKVQTGRIASAAGREKWASILSKHLIPRFGDWYLDKITKRDIEALKVSWGEAKYAPATCNTMLAVLKTILAAASDDYETLADAGAKVEPFDTKAHRTYTAEQPNAFRLEDVVPFLDEMRARWPEHYAMVYLGMWTGLRPSSLRPLRRRGAHADVNWKTGEVMVRRSHTVGENAMLGTKNGDDLTIKLTPEVLAVLRWHVERLDQENVRRADRAPELAAVMAESDLLFPAEPNGRNQGGGFRTKSSLARAFADVGKAIGLAYEVTPRALRRSFQDLTRAAAVSDTVARALCGHRTPAMTAHYSTVRSDEQEAAMGKIISLASARQARAESPPAENAGTPGAAGA